jgi:hypothetical protein
MWCDRVDQMRRSLRIALLADPNGFAYTDNASGTNAQAWLTETRSASNRIRAIRTSHGALKSHFRCRSTAGYKPRGGGAQHDQKRRPSVDALPWWMSVAR